MMPSNIFAQRFAQQPGAAQPMPVQQQGMPGWRPAQQPMQAQPMQAQPGQAQPMPTQPMQATNPMMQQQNPAVMNALRARMGMR